MSLRGSGVARRRLCAAAAMLAAGALAAQEPLRLLETVEVRVVNVDVVVADGEGRTVRGLAADDFELLVGGRPAVVDYFNEVADGAAVAAAGEASDPARLPYLAIVYDGRTLRPASARRAVEVLTARLDRLLASTREVMVLRQGTSLMVEQSMTRDPELLAAALERLAARRTPALGVADRQLLILQLESADPPRLARESEDDLAADRARQLLRQIRSQAEIERFAAEASSRQLRSVVRSMAGLPGRKAILLLGQGLRDRPGEALFRLWWTKFSRYAAQIGLVDIESEIGQVRNDRLLLGLVEDANAHRVAFYTHDPAGVRVVGSSAEYRSLEANLQLAAESERSLDAMLDLALATGGVGRVRSAGVGELLDEMLDGFASYYSLGFTPETAGRGEVRVRLRRRQPGLRVRYLRRFAVRTAAQELAEATLATLLTAAEDNPLEVGVEIGEAERQPDDTFVVPLLIKVPLARLSLLPERARHVGRLSFVVMAQAADGGLSPPATGEVPIAISNAELLSAMGRMAGYRLRLRTTPGEQVLAIGVRDEVARRDATLRLVVAPGRDA